MLRPLLGISESDLERELLRKGVGARAAVNVRCSDCRRTPLEGERLHAFAGGAAVCDLCLPRHPGEPERTERVLQSGRGQTVRRRIS
jgi:hypothetical protein